MYFVLLRVAEFKTLIKYVRELKFEEEPNYISIQQLIEGILVRNNYLCDFIFDWNIQFKGLRSKDKAIFSVDEKELNKLRKEIRYW